MHFGILNYEKQHKEGTCKVSGRSVVISAFYADFCLCPKLVIITTLISIFYINNAVNGAEFDYMHNENHFILIWKAKI